MVKSYLDQLREHLVAIVGADNDGIPQACTELQAAIDDFKSRSYITNQDADGSTIRTRQGIGETRDYLLNLEAKLRAAKDIAGAMLPSAMNLFCDAYGHSHGKLSSELDAAISAVENALQAARNHPDHEKNDDPRILAYRVAIVMRNTLGIPPSTTRDTAENVNFKKGGAAFARLLRAVLALAGFDVRSIPRTQRGSGKKDLGPIIDAGLRLLRDPKLPNRLTTVKPPAS